MIKLVGLSLIFVSCILVTIDLAGSQLPPAWRGNVTYYTGGVSLLACWLSFISVALSLAPERIRQVPYAIVLGMGIRLIITLGGTGLAMVMDWWPMAPLLAWTAAFYFAMLAIETIWTIKLVTCVPGTVQRCSTT